MPGRSGRAELTSSAQTHGWLLERSACPSSQHQKWTEDAKCSVDIQKNPVYLNPEDFWKSSSLMMGLDLVGARCNFSLHYACVAELEVQ